MECQTISNLDEQLWNFEANSKCGKARKEVVKSVEHTALRLRLWAISTKYGTRTVVEMFKRAQGTIDGPRDPQMIANSLRGHTYREKHMKLALIDQRTFSIKSG